jgi:hypothetical protein
MARVEFGQRTHAYRHTHRRTGRRPGRGYTALAVAAFTVLTAAGLTAITIADAGRAVAAAATSAGIPAGRAGILQEPIGGGTTPYAPVPEPSVPPATEPPPVGPPPTTPPATEPPATGAPVEPAPGTPSPVDPPPTTGPAPTQSAQPPSDTAPKPPQQPGQPRLGVAVSTSDIALTSAYWGARTTATELRITVTNTGEVSQFVRLRYTLPPGVTDAGTRGCSAAGGRTYRCGAWTAAVGAQFSTRIQVRVDADAWRRMPLAGSVQVSATDPARPDVATVTDDEGFAVLFPAGPPAPGVTLAADEVNFDVTGQPTTLAVRLGNTGSTDAAGAIEVILPAGVTVPAPPIGCRSIGATPGGPAPASADPASADQSGTARVGCDLGTVRAGSTATVRLPVAATPDAQRMAPLSGAAIGTLNPARGPTGRMQMSFRITAVAAASSAAASANPTGSQGVLPMVRSVSGPDAGLSGVKQTAIGLIVVSGLLVVLALTLAAVTLHRRTP